MHSISLAIAGFTAVCSLLMFLAYAVFIRVPGKSAHSVAACAVLIGGLFALSLGHLQYFQGGVRPLTLPYYAAALYVLPAAFYLFGRWAILPTQAFRPVMLLNFLPVLLFFFGRHENTLPILFTFGTAYSVWLGHLVYGLRTQRKQFRFEFLYFVVMFVLAVVVLALGFAIPYGFDEWFYLFYNFAIGIGIAIMVVALVSNPDLIGDLSEAARVKYGASTLGGVDVDGTLKKLDKLMTDGKAYQNENLSLASLAAELGISAHQLSELVNARLGLGFSRYVREKRVDAAKALLISAPSQSILTVSMDTGFRSQSAFYAAFKEVTGQSPGDFRSSKINSEAAK
jgi:AraC-like DNA-binding protein